MTGTLHGRRYVSVSEFAAATGVAEGTVRERCASGQYRTKPGRKEGQRWRIVASEVEREQGRFASLVR